MNNFDTSDDATCSKCYGEGVVHAHRMGVIGPESEPAPEWVPGDYYVCPRCGGSGRNTDHF